MKADSNLMEEKTNGVGENHTTENGVMMPHSDFYIPGEELIADSTIEHGQIKLTNYRIIIKKGYSKWICIPIKSIETVEGTSPTIKIQCKDVKSIEFTLPSAAQYSLWEPRLHEAAKPLTNPLDAFAIEYYSAMKSTRINLYNTLKQDSLTYEEHMENDFNKEYKRLGFKDSKVWRISNVNENYHLCETYPRHVIVPTSFNDDDLPAAADFRVNRRFPTPVWRHKNGAVLARSSQPSIGIFSNRSAMDERLLDNMSQACGGISDPEETNSESITQSNGVITEERKLLVVDCRTFTSAFANRVRGGGYENIYNYKSVDLQHMNIPNIHSVLQAYTSLRSVLFGATDESRRLIKNEDWYDTISNIMYSALVASEALDKSRPVLVHCSDGWDRTPQITSLAAILLDPFYRTIRGFQTLVEREFVDFGHKFGERNEVIWRSGGEKSPIFLQFLECVYQLIVQFPTEFEYNNEFLMKLGQHIYSNLFGDFLFSTSCERTRADIRNKSFSVWCLFQLNRQQYVNVLYDPECQTLKPSAYSVNLVIWRPFYTWFMKFLPGVSEESPSSSEQQRPEPRRISSCPELFTRAKVLDQDFELVEIDDINGPSMENLYLSATVADSWDMYLADSRLNIKGKMLVNQSMDTNDVFTNKAKETIVSNKTDKNLIESRLREPLASQIKKNLVASNIDGLNFIEGDRERVLLEKSVRDAKLEIEMLQWEVKKVKEVNRQIIQSSLTPHDTVEDQHSLPDGVGSGSQGGQESVVSDSSWEAVEAAENPANWTPDHAASYCMDCQKLFWTGLRKHHCGNCGKVFCDMCTGTRLPVPKENLHVPVRVCRSCVEQCDSPSRSPPMAVSN